MLLSDISFRANPAERLQTRAPWSPARTGGVIAAVCAVLIHAAVLSLLIFENRLWPDNAPTSIEIPVEIVIEPPPPEKPPEPAPAPLPPPPIDLKPAFDAPAPANKEKIEREAADEATKAPPPTPDEQKPASAKTGGSTSEDTLHAPSTPIDGAPDRPADELIPPPRQANLKAPEQQPPAETSAEQQNQARSAGQKFPTFEPLPEVEFAGAAKSTPIAGGKAKSTYLTILYGMIASHIRTSPVLATSSPRARGSIVFTVDALGNIMQRRIARSSGAPALDVAALNAVGQAAPFPPPPNGAPVGLIYSFGAR
jgi:TonB family protein